MLPCVIASIGDLIALYSTLFLLMPFYCVVDIIGEKEVGGRVAAVP